MSAGDIEKIKAKIAKLMALATDGGATENEAETAMRHAEALMRKHSIDLATIHATGKAESFTWVKAWVPVYPDGGVATSAPTWISIVAQGVARFTDCTAIWDRHPEKGMRILFKGETSDVAYAVYLQGYLQEVVRREVGKFAGTRREHNDFKHGMVGRLQHRLYQLKAEQREALHKHKVGTGTALVVVDQKLAERDQVFGPPPGTRKHKRSGDLWAHEQGRKAGDRVGFGRPVEGGGVVTKRLGHK